MNIALRLAAGAAMGVCFYGGLWLTVRALLTSAHPVLLSVASFWGRTLAVVGGFLLVANGRWTNAAAALAGFAAGRAIVGIVLRRERCT